jgi:hypothetical protein
MTYLHPPPGDVPVIVTKDVGGYVDQYAAMTRLYAQTGREVRLHECRSACTLALSLPNVCVYPDSLLKFHKAYNPLTRVANDEVSEAMMAAYPAAVRERLGDLTRNYKVLTGSELIRLGVRDCGRPAGPVYAVARAKAKPAEPAPGWFGKVAAAFSPAAPVAVQGRPQRVQTATARVAPLEAPPPETASDAPLPPPRPEGLAVALAEVTPASQPAAPQVASPAPPALEDAPEPPPPRPAGLGFPAPPSASASAPAPTQVGIAAWRRKISGSAPILEAKGFARMFYRAISKS